MIRRTLKALLIAVVAVLFGYAYLICINDFRVLNIEKVFSAGVSEFEYPLIVTNGTSPIWSVSYYESFPGLTQEFFIARSPVANAERSHRPQRAAVFFREYSDFRSIKQRREWLLNRFIRGKNETDLFGVFRVFILVINKIIRGVSDTKGIEQLSFVKNISGWRGTDIFDGQFKLKRDAVRSYDERASNFDRESQPWSLIYASAPPIKADVNADCAESKERKSRARSASIEHEPRPFRHFLLGDDIPLFALIAFIPIGLGLGLASLTYFPSKVVDARTEIGFWGGLALTGLIGLFGVCLAATGITGLVSLSM